MSLFSPPTTSSLLTVPDAAQLDPVSYHLPLHHSSSLPQPSTIIRSRQHQETY